MNRRQHFWRQVGLLAGKDLKIFFLDRGALVFALIFPFAFVVMFSLVLGNSYGGQDKAMTVYVATAEPAGSLSRQVIDVMTGSGDAGEEGARSHGGLVIKQANPDKAREALAKEQIGGYLLFPEGFTDAILSGEPANLVVYANPEAATTRAALLSIAQSIASEFESYLVMTRAVGELAGGSPVAPPPGAGTAGPGGVGDGAGALAATGAAVAAPGTTGTGQDIAVRLVYEKVGDIEPPRPADILIPGYLTMFVFFALALTAETLVGEKENYTLERMVAGTASRLSIVTGKIAGSFGRGLIQVAVFWIAGNFIFHVRMGHYPWAAVLVSVLLTLAAAGIGVFLATVVKTRKAAASVAVFVSLSFAAFGGSWWPLFVMPQWLQNLAKITPHAWANSAFNKLMLFGATPANVVPEMVALGVFAVVFGGLAVWRFKVVD